MKATEKIIRTLTLACLLITVQLGHAQNLSTGSAASSTATSVAPIALQAGDVSSLRTLSNDQLTAFVNALDALPTMPAVSLPRHGLIGSFFSLQNPSLPPLPMDSAGVDVWPLSGSDGGYLLNDVNVDYDALSSVRASRRLGMRLDDDGIPVPPGDYGDDTNTYTSAYTPMVIDTNLLWLEMITVTNQIASLVIHPPLGVSNEVYDLEYCTNLMPPIAWQWLLRSEVDQTNLLVPNASDDQGFYRLGPPNDSTANSSLGTNFWTAFCGLFYNQDRNNQLSLFISSPSGATGTVTTPALIVNGSILIVTNCGDAALNGTYILTNLTAQEQTDWQNNGLSTNDAYYADGTNWAMASTPSDFCYLFSYDSVIPAINFLYSKSGVNLNGSATDWNYDGDPALPPTTLCAQLPLVNQTFTIAAGGLTNINIPLLAMQEFYDTETNGIHIVTDRPVAVYALDFDAAASAAFTAYPTSLLGTNYCVMSYPGYDGYSQLAVVATEDDTTVTIIPSPDSDLFGPNGSDPYTNLLQTGETYQVQAGNDVTGTLITSDKPIVVLAGASLAYVQGNAGNPLVQEQMPVETWGTEALALSFAGRMYGDTYRVLTANSNTVTISGAVVDPDTLATNYAVVVTNLAAGQFYETILTGPVEFQANQPIQVAHFANGNGFDNATNNPNGYSEADPSEILVPPIGHYLETNVVASGPSLDFSSSPPGGFDENFLNIIVVQSAITNTFVDGSHIAATNFMPISTSGYYGAQIGVANGKHSVTSSQPVGVEVYGFGYYDAYGYFGGIVK